MDSFTSFIVDNSGSMSGSNKGIAEILVRGLFDEMHRYSMLRFVCFHDRSYPASGVGGKFHQHTDANWLNSQFIRSDWNCNGGSTALWSAVLEGCGNLIEQKRLFPEKSFSLVVVTDGDDNASGTVVVEGRTYNLGGGDAGLQTLLNFIQEQQLDVAIHILGIGSISGEPARRFQTIAEKTQGQWEHVTNPSAAAAVVTGIVDRFKTAILTRQPPRLWCADYNVADGTVAMDWEPHVSSVKDLAGFVIERCPASATESTAPDALSIYEVCAPMIAPERRTMRGIPTPPGYWWYRIRGLVKPSNGSSEPEKTQSSKAILVHATEPLVAKMAGMEKKLDSMIGAVEGLTKLLLGLVNNGAVSAGSGETSGGPVAAPPSSADSNNGVFPPPAPN